VLPNHMLDINATVKKAELNFNEKHKNDEKALRGDANTES